MRFSRQEYWSRLPFPSPRDLPDLGIEPTAALQADSLLLNHQGSPFLFLLLCLLSFRQVENNGAKHIPNAVLRSCFEKLLLRWWWTGRPGMLDSWGCKESDTTEQLNWTEAPIKLGVFLPKSDSLVQGTAPPSYTTLPLSFLWPWPSSCLSHDCSLIVLSHDSTPSSHPRVCSWFSSLSYSTYSFKDPAYAWQILSSLLMILSHFSLAHLSPSMYFQVFHRYLRLREPRLQLVLSFSDSSYLCQVSSSSIIFYSAILLSAKILVPSGVFLNYYFCLSILPASSAASPCHMPGLFSVNIVEWMDVSWVCFFLSILW